ncbi:MAG TPA: hypothetical protein VMW56_14465 [Candidatus Margulisiibacteriota bacterium]|nr:hypothetical protein [Candidatus Margulisiibacteriota bacterium]
MVVWEPVCRVVTDGKDARHLSLSEARILDKIYDGRVGTREELLNAVYGHKPYADWPNAGTSLDVILHKLRRKLSAFKISTINVRETGWHLSQPLERKHLAPAEILT